MKKKKKRKHSYTKGNIVMKWDLDTKPLKKNEGK